MAAKFIVVLCSLAALGQCSVVPLARADADYTSFAYNVADPNTGDYKSQVETRVGGAVSGQYSLLDADGTKRTVDYTADDVNGFNAVVRKDPAVVATAPVVSAPVVASAPVFAAAPAVAARAVPTVYSAPAAVYSAPVVARSYAAPVVAQTYSAPVVAPVTQYAQVPQYAQVAPVARSYFNPSVVSAPFAYGAAPVTYV